MTILIVVALTSFLISALTLFSGFGLGTLLLPAFALFFPLEVAVAATAVVHLANNVFKFFIVGRLADLKVTLKFSIPAMLGAGVGAWLLSQIGTSPSITTYTLMGREFHIEPIKLLLGFLIGFFAIIELLSAEDRYSLPPKFIPLGGLISGFFGGLSGLQGALRSMFLLRAGLSKDQFVGTTVSSAILIDISRLSVYGFALLGKHIEALKSPEIKNLIIAAIASAFFGSVLSAQLLQKTTMKTIQRVVAGLLLVISIGLMGGML